MTSPHFTTSIETYGELSPYLSFEWLLTNGIGGFSASSVVDCNTRRYHGVLCAALNPPVGRVISVNRLGEVITLDGKSDKTIRTSVSQFHDTIFPRGDQYLRRFELGETAKWHYAVEDISMTRELLLCWGKNVVGLRYTVKTPPSRSVQLQLLPFVGLRDFHGLRSSSNAYFGVNSGPRIASVSEGSLSVYVQSDAGLFDAKSDWWYRHTYSVEAERGQDNSEDLFVPGSFNHDMSGDGQITLWISVEPIALPDWDKELAYRIANSNPGKITASNSPTSSAAAASSTAALPYTAVSRLLRAAADFVVTRKTPDGTTGKTVVAGYPWFADWGRDTMISLPGLFLTTQRFTEAAQVLSVFAQYTREGMIPNRFDDYSNEPCYNTVDASLWFIHSVYEYLRLSGDRKTFETQLLPACQQIIDGYSKGTRFSIKMDPADSLISSGDASTQLTWMDAKCNGIAFTPRQGKAVEINALWYNALKLMGKNDLAEKVAASFQKQFWNSYERGCFDVVNEYGRDGQIRPNQIFAASLPHSPLSAEQRIVVVEVVRRELLTPYGLRTLARGEHNYQGRYTGDQMRRDQAYHNGTVWPWLIGAFLEAYVNSKNKSPDAIAQARLWLKPLLDSMDRGCIGQIAEIFDGDEPHRPVGCFAQAWSVAEVLRLAVMLGVE